MISCPNNAKVIVQYIKKYNWKTGAELGVRRGEFSTYILQEFNDFKMYLVDIWNNHTELNESHYHEENYKTTLNNIEPYKDRAIILKGLTTEMCHKVKDKSLDFIFIDATHTYDSVIKDIKAWYPKLKDTGWITGHDYHSAYGGVIEAVNEIFDNKFTEFDTCWFGEKKNAKI